MELFGVREKTRMKTEGIDDYKKRREALMAGAKRSFYGERLKTTIERKNPVP